MVQKYSDEEMLYGIEVAREGTTTDAGAAGGDSLIDTALIGMGANSFEGMTVVVYPGDPARVDSFGIPSGGFNNGTGEITLSHAYKGGQIPAGAPYAILVARAAITGVEVAPEATGTFSFDETNAGEQTAFTVAITARSKIGGIWIDMANITQNTTIRVKHQIDGANYRTFTTLPWLTTDDDGVLVGPFTAYRNVQVSLQCGGGGGGSVDVPYAVV